MQLAQIGQLKFHQTSSVQTSKKLDRKTADLLARWRSQLACWTGSGKVNSRLWLLFQLNRHFVAIYCRFEASQSSVGCNDLQWNCSIGTELGFLRILWGSYLNWGSIRGITVRLRVQCTVKFLHATSCIFLFHITRTVHITQNEQIRGAAWSQHGRFGPRLPR